MTDRDEVLSEILERCAQATPGNWDCSLSTNDGLLWSDLGEQESRSGVRYIAVPLVGKRGMNWTDESVRQSEANWTFIKHARQDIQTLAALVAEARDESGRADAPTERDADLDKLREAAKPLGEYTEGRAREFLDVTVARAEAIETLAILCREARDERDAAKDKLRAAYESGIEDGEAAARMDALLGGRT